MSIYRTLPLLLLLCASIPAAAASATAGPLQIVPVPVPEPRILITDSSPYSDIGDEWTVIFDVEGFTAGMNFRFSTDRNDLIKIYDTGVDVPHPGSGYELRGGTTNHLEIVEFPQIASITIELLSGGDTDIPKVLAKEEVQIKVFSSDLIRIKVTPERAWFSPQTSSHSFSAAFPGFEEEELGWSVTSTKSYSVNDEGTVRYTHLPASTYVTATPKDEYLASKIKTDSAFGFFGELSEEVTDLTQVAEGRYTFHMASAPAGEASVTVDIPADVYAEFALGKTYVFDQVSVRVMHLDHDPGGKMLHLSGPMPALGTIYSSLAYETGFQALDVPREGLLPLDGGVSEAQETGGGGDQYDALPIFGSAKCGNVHTFDVNGFLDPTMKIVVDPQHGVEMAIGGVLVTDVLLKKGYISSGQQGVQCEATLGFNLPVAFLPGLPVIFGSISYTFGVEVLSELSGLIPATPEASLSAAYKAGGLLKYSLSDGRAVLTPVPGSKVTNAVGNGAATGLPYQQDMDISIELKTEAPLTWRLCDKKGKICFVDVAMPSAEHYIKLRGQATAGKTSLEKVNTDDYVSPRASVRHRAPVWPVKSVSAGALGGFLKSLGLHAVEIEIPPVWDFVSAEKDGLNRDAPEFRLYENTGSDVVYAGNASKPGYPNTVQLELGFTDMSDWASIRTIELKARNLGAPDSEYQTVATIPGPYRQDMTASFKPPISMAGTYRFKPYVDYKPGFLGFPVDIVQLPITPAVGLDIEIRPLGIIHYAPQPVVAMAKPGESVDLVLAVQADPSASAIVVDPQDAVPGDFAVWTTGDAVTLDANNGFFATVTMTLTCPETVSASGLEGQLILEALGIDHFVDLLLHCNFIEVDPEFAYRDAQIGDTVDLEYSIKNLTAGQITVSNAFLVFDSGTNTEVLEADATTHARLFYTCSTEGYHRSDLIIQASDGQTQIDTPVRYGVNCNPKGSSDGDPHLQTFDGLAYDFQGFGEFIMFERSDGKLSLQARLGNESPSPVVTFNKAVAINLVDQRVGFYTGEHKPVEDGRVMHNGVPLSLAVGDHLEITVTGYSGKARIERPDSARYLFRLPDGEGAIEVRFAQHGRSRIDLKTFLLPNSALSYVGLMGNYDGDPANDLKLRTGTVIPAPDFDAFYDCGSGKACFAYGDEGWLITEGESHFDYPPGKGSSDYTQSDEGIVLPSSDVVLPAPSSPEYQAIESQCRQAGIHQSRVLASCIYDVFVTGNNDLIADYVAIQTPESYQVDPILGMPESCPDLQAKYGIETSGRYLIENPRELRVWVYCHFDDDLALTFLYEKLTTKSNSTLSYCPYPNDSLALFVPRSQREMEIARTAAKVLGMKGLGSLGFFLRAERDGEVIYHDQYSVDCDDTVFNLAGLAGKASCKNLKNILAHTYPYGNDRGDGQDFLIWSDTTRPYPKYRPQSYTIPHTRNVYITYDPDTLEIVDFDYIVDRWVNAEVEPFPNIAFDQLCVGRNLYDLAPLQ